MKKEYDLKKLKKRPITRVSQAATKVPISIRLDGSLLAHFQSEAHRLGIPYQTLISSVLYRYMNGEFVDKKPTGPRAA